MTWQWKLPNKPDTIYVHESTDTISSSQLLVFLIYIDADDMREEFVICSALEAALKSHDSSEKINTFLKRKWKVERLCKVCTDGPPAQLGTRSDFLM